MDIVSRISNFHADAKTKLYCMYMYFFQGINKSNLSKLFNKSIATICQWIDRYESGEGLSRKESTAIYKKFGLQKRQWLIELYEKRPVLYLDEAKHEFESYFKTSISSSSVFLILREAGLSWKTLERRAIQINQMDIIRFSLELTKFPWLLENLVFLDEVSFDNRGMLRKKGYGIKGKRLLYRGEFCRKPRVSLLCFIGVNGLLETYSTDGTFDRLKFSEKCRLFTKKVKQYPEQYSVWILDGAKIHTDPNIVYYLRSMGIVVIFLPAYCPFFNPIEIFFGVVKKRMRKFYEENSKKDFLISISEILNSFLNFSFENIFRKCGYTNMGFNPSVGLNQELKKFGFE
jgi:transposase